MLYPVCLDSVAGLEKILFGDDITGKWLRLTGT